MVRLLGCFPLLLGPASVLASSISVDDFSEGASVASALAASSSSPDRIMDAVIDQNSRSLQDSAPGMFITYESHEKDLKKALKQSVGISPTEFPASQCGGYPTDYEDDIYIILYGAELLNEEELSVFNSIFKQVMTECTGGCYTTEDIYVVFQALDEFDYDEFIPDTSLQHGTKENRRLLDGEDEDDAQDADADEGIRELQGGRKKRNKKRGRRNVVKTRVKGKRWSSRQGQKLSLTQGKTDDSLSGGGDSGARRERDLASSGSGRVYECGEQLKNALMDTKYQVFDCIAIIQITLFDPRCYREPFRNGEDVEQEVARAQQGGGGGGGTGKTTVARAGKPDVKKTPPRGGAHTGAGASARTQAKPEEDEEEGESSTRERRPIQK